MYVLLMHTVETGTIKMQGFNFAHFNNGGVI